MAIKYVIQARENSSRFPRKCFAKINGKWIIQYIIDACANSKYFYRGEIIFVIPKNDIELRESLREYRICTSKDNNCLMGYAEAVDKGDIIVRLTADSPMVTTDEIDKNIDKVLEGYEYASNEITMFGNCCEVFTGKAFYYYSDLKKDREHITVSMREQAYSWIPSLMVDYAQSIKHIEDYLDG